jgi:hypothetical protein
VRAAEPRYWRRHRAAIADGYAEERFIPLVSSRAIAVNCRNKPRFRKRLTVYEGGLIMQFAWGKVAAAQAGIGAIFVGLPRL